MLATIEELKSECAVLSPSNVVDTHRVEKDTHLFSSRSPSSLLTANLYHTPASGGGRPTLTETTPTPLTHSAAPSRPTLRATSRFSPSFPVLMAPRITLVPATSTSLSTVPAAAGNSSRRSCTYVRPMIPSG